MNITSIKVMTVIMSLKFILLKRESQSLEYLIAYICQFCSTEKQIPTWGEMCKRFVEGNT